MFRAKKRDVIAVGPMFPGQDARVDPRRVMLVKHRNEEGDTSEYVVITQSKPKDGTAMTRTTKRRVSANNFTHAVRMFCDHILEQAWCDDMRDERAPGR